MAFLWFLVVLPLAIPAAVYFFVRRKKPDLVVRVYPIEVVRDPLKELYQRIERWEVWKCEACGVSHVGIKGDCLLQEERRELRP
jgi:hypothetical protein